MIRNVSAVKRNRLMKSIIALALSVVLLSGTTGALAATTPTVDNSVDKSTTRVMGVLKLTGCTGLPESLDDGLTVYDSDKVKVDYSNPTNEYIQSLIEAAKGKAERLGQEVVDNDSGYCTLKPAVTEKSESSYDNRVYTWVKDDESDDGILVGDPDSGAVGNQNRHMVITGDYARTTTYTVTVELVYPDHVWDEGVVTKEATETEEGIRTFTCAGCGETKTEVIPKLNGEPVEIEKPVYKGDIVADGMIHQISEFYDFSGLPEGTVIILNIDGETQYISVPDELQRLEVREPVEIPFELELPQGYIFEKNAGPSHIMYCTVRVLGATDPVSYTIIAGVNSEWTKETSTGLSFTSDAPFAKFDSVKVDGSAIAATNYTAEKGSTKITLAPSYLETLSVGAHSIEIVSNDGSASTNFTVKAAVPANYTVTFNMNGQGTQITAQTIEDGNKATKPADPTASGYNFDGWYTDATFSAKFDFDSAITADTTVYAKWTKNSVIPTDPTSPQTGDNSHLLLWVSLLLISSAALTVTVIYGRKREHN